MMTFLRLLLFAIFAATGEYLLVHSAGQFASEAFAFEAFNDNSRDHYAQGEQAALSAARLNPLNGYAQYHVASSQYLLDRYNEAAQQASLALPIMPHRASVFRLRGECLFELHKYADATRDMLDFLTLTPQPPSNAGHLMIVAAESLLETGRPGESAFWLNRASSDRSVLGKAQELKLKAAMTLKDSQMLSNALLTMLTHSGEMRFNGPELLKNALAANEWALVTTALENVSAARPGSQAVTRTLATAYVRASNPKGLEYLKAAIARDDTDSELHFMLGDLFFRMKRYPEAEAQFSRVLALDPNSPFAVEIERRRADMR